MRFIIWSRTTWLIGWKSARSKLFWYLIDSRADFVGNQGNPLTQHTTLTPIMIVASGRQAAGVKDELDSQCADFILAALTIPRPVSCRREFAAFRLS
jgi:hypothetical protein